MRYCFSIGIFISLLAIGPTLSEEMAESAPSPVEAATCKPVQIQDDYAHLQIDTPGHYCLTQDFTKRCLVPTFFYLGEGGCRGISIDIKADDVDLDFKGHRLTSWSSGISIESYKKRVTLRNGILNGPTGIYLTGSGGPRPGTVLPYVELRSRDLLGPGKPESLLPHNPNVRYEDLDFILGETKHKIEKMVIDSKRANVIMLNGTGNVVRNNRIRFRATNQVHADGTPHEYFKDDYYSPANYADTRVGILNYGGNTLIENNEIIQDTDNKGVIPAYTIYLRKAPGSIVRGNKITLKGTKKKTIAIGLRDSTDVVVEDNVIKGAETPIEQVGDSSARLNRNQIK